MNVVLATQGECATLAGSAELWRLPGSGTTIQVALSVDPAIRDAWQSEVDKLLKICGCAASALATLITFATCLAMSWLFPAAVRLSGHPALDLVIAAALAVVVGGMIKTATLWHVQRRLRTLLQRMAASPDTDSEEAPRSGLCRSVVRASS